MAKKKIQQILLSEQSEPGTVKLSDYIKRLQGLLAEFESQGFSDITVTFTCLDYNEPDTLIYEGLREETAKEVSARQLAAAKQKARRAKEKALQKQNDLAELARLKSLYEDSQ